MNIINNLYFMYDNVEDKIISLISYICLHVLKAGWCSKYGGQTLPLTPRDCPTFFSLKFVLQAFGHWMSTPIPKRPLSNPSVSCFYFKTPHRSITSSETLSLKRRVYFSFALMCCVYARPAEGTVAPHWTPLQRFLITPGNYKYCGMCQFYRDWSSQ